MSVILELRELIQMILDKKIDVAEDDLSNFLERSKVSSYKNCSALFVLAKQRLQFILRHLIKICLMKPPINKDCTRLVEIYKNSYSLTFDLENCNEFMKFITKFNNILIRIEDYINDIDVKQQ